ncbi:ROK family protein [Virgibacillus sp. FSP13]
MEAEYLSIDIGGTYIKYAFMNDEHQLHGHQKVETKENTNNAILKQIEDIIKSATSNYTVKGIGISTAGIVDREKGEIIYAGPTIKNYKGTAFKAHLSQLFDLPIHVENDVNAALLGELWKGAASSQDHAFCITLGTGIGGAYYHDQLVDGFHHQANSVGYLLYDKETGTNYESRASTTALNQLINNELGGGISTKTVFDRAKRGDEKCMSIIETWAQEVAKGLAQIIIMTDPKCILIGGGISKQGDHLLKPIQKYITQFLPSNFLKAELKIAQLFNNAALYGAVYPFFKEEF